MDDSLEVDQEDFNRIFELVSNWGKFGSSLEIGTLNFLSTAEVLSAVRLIQEGRVISVSAPLDGSAGPDNPKPMLRYMTELCSTGPLRDQGNAEESYGQAVGYNMDFYGFDYHGMSVSHVDALCHIAYRGELFGGKTAHDAVGAHGSSFGGINNASTGIVGRGVLLDAAHVAKVAWLEPAERLYPEQLEEIEVALDVKVTKGDIVLVRTGRFARRGALGPWDTSAASAGLDVRCMPWLAERQIAALGSDGDSDLRPSPVVGVNDPIHVLALAAMGMSLLDNLCLEELADACTETGRYEFFFVCAPLVVPGGTGSPVNPLAIL